MRRTIELGFSYLPESIRVTLNDIPLLVEETNPATGRIDVELSRDGVGEILIEFQRTLYRGGARRPDRTIGIADALLRIAL